MISPTLSSGYGNCSRVPQPPGSHRWDFPIVTPLWLNPQHCQQRALNRSCPLLVVISKTCHHCVRVVYPAPGSLPFPARLSFFPTISGACVPAALRGIAAPVGTLGFTLAVVMPSIPEEGPGMLRGYGQEYPEAVIHNSHLGV